MNHKKQKPLIEPVKREDFSITLGGNANSINTTPEERFAPLASLIPKMAVGPHFWFVADLVNGKTQTFGGTVKRIIKVEEDFVTLPPDLLFKSTHPEDIIKMFAFTNYWIGYYTSVTPERQKTIRPSIYIRMLSPEDAYKWFMVQYIDQITDNDGKIIYALTLVTDISHIRKNGVAMMSILDTLTESCQLFFCADGKALPDSGTVLPKISPRELEVLRLLAAGNSSKQIAAVLDTAVKTVDNHRQNMLHKTHTKNSGELVAYAINMGFI